MFIPVLLYVNGKPNHFRDISLMLLYLSSEYKNIRFFKPGEKTLVVRKGKKNIILEYEILTETLAEYRKEVNENEII